MQKIAVVTDFDGTLMEQDVGDILMEGLDVLIEPRVLPMLHDIFERKRLVLWLGLKRHTPCWQVSRSR